MKEKSVKKLPSKVRIPIIILLSLAALIWLIYGILVLIRANAAPVNVYSVKDITFNSQWASQSETQGRVTADRMQTVYISSTQIVNEIFVNEGDTVKAGDPLLSFDTTLTDMQLKRQEIKVSQLDLEIQQAEKELRIINTYRVGSPVVHTETAENLPVYEYYGTLITDRGRGTADDPYVFVWNQSIPFSPADIVALGIKPLPAPPEEGGEAGTGETPTDPGAGETPADPGTGETPADPGTGETPADPGTGETPADPGTGADTSSDIPDAPPASEGGEAEQPSDPGTGSEGGSEGGGTAPDPIVPVSVTSTVCAVFESREGNSMLGQVADSYMAVCTRGSDGKYSVKITSVPPTYDPKNPPVKPAPVDNTVYISTWSELNAMKKEAQDKITSLQMDKKKAALELETLKYELTNGIILSKVDGVVKTLNDPEAVTGTSDPVMIVSGGGGFFVTGALSETELSVMHPGDIVNIMSWESYQNYEAEIISISEFPAEGNEYYHYSQGNSNASLYPFTAAISEDAVLREGEYVNITYTPEKEGGSGFYVQNMFIRTENGQSYVYVENSEKLLERRNIVTGGSLWGSYTEIFSGLSEEDHVAFPYGKNVKPGAKVNESSIDALYNY